MTEVQQIIKQIENLGYNIDYIYTPLDLNNFIDDNQIILTIKE